MTAILFNATVPESADVIKNNANTIIDRRLVKLDNGKYSRNAKSSCSGLSVNAKFFRFCYCFIDISAVLPKMINQTIVKTVGIMSTPKDELSNSPTF